MRQTAVRGSPLAVACVVVIVASYALTACGGDPYSGTWESTIQFVNADTGQTSRSTLVIATSGDGWTVRDALGRSFFCDEENGKLVTLRGPTGVAVSNGTVFERKGDGLLEIESGTKVMEYQRE